jgi:hypothetical protein
MHTDIHASSGIRTHDLSVWAGEDSPYLDRAGSVIGYIMCLLALELVSLCLSTIIPYQFSNYPQYLRSRTYRSSIVIIWGGGLYFTILSVAK